MPTLLSLCAFVLAAAAIVLAGLNIAMADDVVAVKDAVTSNGPSAPDLAGWLGSLKEPTGDFPLRLVFLLSLSEKAGDLPDFLPLNRAAFEKLSYLRLVDSADAAWDFKLNRSKFIKADPFDAVLQSTRADTVVVAPKKGPWKLLRKVKGEKTEVFAGKGPANVTPEGIVDWLFAVFNWDGIVLAQRPDYLLVGAKSKLLKTAEIQALAVTDSQGKFILAADERKGSGLVSLGETRDGIGVFDIVILGKGVKMIAPGTKVIMEKK